VIRSEGIGMILRRKCLLVIFGNNLFKGLLIRLPDRYL